MIHFTAHQRDQRTWFETGITRGTYPRRLPQYRDVQKQAVTLGLHVDYNNYGAPTMAHAPGMRFPLSGWSHLHDLMTHLADLARETNLRPHDYANEPTYPDGQCTQTVPIERAAHWSSPTGRLARLVVKTLTCDIGSLPEKSQEPSMFGPITSHPRREAQAAYRAAAFQWLWGLGVMGGPGECRYVKDPNRPSLYLGRVGTSQRVTLEEGGVLIRFGLRPDQFGMDADRPTLTSRITFPVRHALLDTVRARLETHAENR